MDACEDYPNGIPPFARFGERWKSVDLDTEYIRKALALDPEKKQTLYEYWHKIVQAYSSCQLTRAEDKLVAISGLAKRVQSCLGDEYLAGLWKESLPLELLWSACYDIAHEPHPTRSSFYRAPTWSWASEEGIIRYENDDYMTGDLLADLGVLPSTARITPANSSRKSPSPQHSGKMAIEPFTQCIDILATSVDLATTDLTGQVTNGFIRLRGTLVAVCMEPETRPDGRLVDHEFVVDLRVLPHKSAFLSPDFDLKAKRGRAGLFFLPIMTTVMEGLRGLFLELVDPINQLYERLGLLQIDDYYIDFDYSSDDLWKKTFEPQVLTLI